MLEEGDERGCDRHHLTCGDVHVVHAIAGDEGRVLTGDTAQDVLFGEGSVLVESRRGLSDEVAVLVIGGQVLDLVGDLTVAHDTVGGLNETERIDARESRERTDQTNVRAFRGFDRAHTTVVRGVNVTDLHAGAVAREATGAESRKAALVGQARERVVLIHELRQLGGSEELLDRGDDGTDVDQRLRRDRIALLGRHALTDGAFHAGQAVTNLRLDEFTYRADATVTEVVDVVGLDANLNGLSIAETSEGLLTLVEGEQILHGGDNILDRQGRGLRIRVNRELLIDLVTTDLREVVALVVEVEVVEQGLRGIDVRGLAGAELAVHVEESFLLRVNRVLLEGFEQNRVVGELLADLRLGQADRLEEVGDGLLALAVDAHAHGVTLVDLEFKPGAARGDDLRAEDVPVGGAV